jgi:hypothetical protein
MRISGRRALFPVLLAILCVILFSRGLIFGGVFTFRDLLFFHYPLRHVWIDQVLHGQFPFLNPGIDGGQPVLANPNYAVFYPGNILYLLLPFDTAWNLSLAAHALWAGLGVYALCRHLRCENHAAFLGAIVFGFGGSLISCATYYNLLTTGSWTPWILLAVLQFLERGTGYIKIVLMLATLLLAGEPTIVLVSAILVAALWIGRGPGEHSWPRHLRTGMLLAAPALMIAAIQLAPTLMWIPHTTRGEGLDFRLAAAYWSFHPARIIEFFIPRYFGDIMSPFTRDYWGGPLSDSGYPYVVMVYCGWLPLLLAPFSFRRRAGKAALLLAAVALILSFGHRLPGYRILFEVFPFYRIIRYPEKFLIFVQLGVSIAATMGFQEVMTRRPDKRFWIFSISLLLMAVAASLIAGRGLPISAEQITIQARNIRNALLIGAGTTALLALTTHPKWRHLAPVVLPLLLVGDLLPITFGILSTTPGADMRRPPQLSASLKGRTIYHRGESQEKLYFSGGVEPEIYMRESLYPFYGLVWNTRYGNAADVDRMLWLVSQQRSANLQRRLATTAGLDLMRKSGIQAVISLTPLEISGLNLQSDIALAPDKKVYLYRLDPTLPLVSWERGSGRLTWNDQTPYRIQIKAQSSGGVLNVLINALPGWRCEIDGARAPVESTALGWIRIQIPAGEHTIQLKFVPPGLPAGAILSITGILFALAAGLRKR